MGIDDERKILIDDELAKKLEEFDVDTELFPEAPIEAVAQTAWRELLSLRDQLEDAPVEEPAVDPRRKIHDNNQFIKEKIEPHVGGLLKRTDPQGVYFSRKRPYGYEFMYSADGLDAISFALHPGLLIDLDDPVQIRLVWDTTPHVSRAKLRAFSNMTRIQIVDHFLMFTEEYLDPKEKVDSLFPNKPPTPGTE